MVRFLLVTAAAFAISATPVLAQPQTCPLEGDAKQALAKELNPYKNREEAPAVDQHGCDAACHARGRQRS